MIFEKILTFVTGRVNQELLLKNEYLVEQLAITIKTIEHLNKRLKLTDLERIKLAKLAKNFNPQALEEASLIVKPETVKKWYRRLIAKSHDYSHLRKKKGRPKTTKDIENLILQMANDNCTWGYKRIAASIKNLDETISPITVKNILIRNGLPSSGKRKK